MKPLSIARALSHEAMVSGRLRYVFPAGAAFPFTVLLLPAIEPGRDAVAAASYSIGLLTLLVWFFALTAPAYLSSPKSGWGLGSLLHSRPVTALEEFAGRALGGIWVTLLWLVVASAATWAALSAAESGAAGGPVETKSRIPWRSAFVPAGGILPAGEPAVFGFLLEEADFGPGPLDARIDAAFSIARPEPGEMGASVNVRAVNAATGFRFDTHADVLNPRRPLSFLLPREAAFPGGGMSVEISLGASPFACNLTGDRMYVVGRGRGRFAGFAACAICAGLLALGLSVVSTAVSQAVSFEVAALFGISFGLAGAVSGYAGRMAHALVRFPRSHDHGGGFPPGLRTAFLEAAGLVCSAFPDLPACVPARDFAEGFDAPLRFLAASAAAAGLMAAAGAAAGIMAASAARGRPRA